MRNKAQVSFSLGDLMESVAPPSVGSASDTPATVGTYLRWVVAALSLAAAVIHFGFAPTHMAEDWAEGWFFLIVGWLQAAFAIAIITRPRQWVWAVGLVVNLGVLVTWAVTRTVGLPFGPGGEITEAVGTPDTVAALIEGVIVVAAAVALLFPQVLERRTIERSFAGVFAGSVAALAIVAGSVSLTPAYAGSHGAGGHGEEAASGGHDDGHGEAAAGAHDSGHVSSAGLDGTTAVRVVRSSGLAGPGRN